MDKTIYHLGDLRIRPEKFGGIICLDDPAALVFVDKKYMGNFNIKDASIWQRKDDGVLVAPTEVHFSITNSCPLKCQDCYMDSGQRGKDEISTLKAKKILYQLSKMGVFHIAFGGGECFSRPDFIKLARYCRKIGMVPNLTTNGYYITEKLAKDCRVFGRINVSIDGVGNVYKKVRGFDGFSMADKALKKLIKAGNITGINYVVTKENFSHIKDFVVYAQRVGAQDILFLRFKPAGRGKKRYYQRKLTPKQNQELYPLLLKLQSKTKVMLGLDCSFIPMMCAHSPDVKEMDFFFAHSCEAGNILAGVLPNGKYQACSFCEDFGGDISRFKKDWQSSPYFKKFRDWSNKAKEPCKSCRYLPVCKGGCHVVVLFETGDLFSPDPDCPLVHQYQLAKK